MEKDSRKLTYKTDIGNKDCLYYLINYRAIQCFDRNKIVDRIGMYDRKGNTKAGVDFSFTYTSNGNNQSEIEYAIAKKQELIEMLENRDKELPIILNRIDKVMNIIKNIDNDIYYILKRYYIDKERTTTRIISAELFLCERVIARKKKKGLQMYVKYYTMLEN